MVLRRDEIVRLYNYSEEENMWNGVLEGYELLGELDGDEEGLGGHEKRWEGEVVGKVWVKMEEEEEIN